MTLFWITTYITILCNMQNNVLVNGRIGTLFFGGKQCTVGSTVLICGLWYSFLRKVNI